MLFSIVMPVILTAFIVSSFFLYYLAYIKNDKVVNIWIYKNKSLIKYLLALSNFLISLTIIFSYTYIFPSKFNISKYIFYLYMIVTALLNLISYIVSFIKKDKFINILNKSLINLIIYILLLFPVTFTSCIIIDMTNVTHYGTLIYTLTDELKHMQTILLHFISNIISFFIFITYKMSVFEKRRYKLW